MHRPSFILTAIAMLALAGCNRAAPTNATANAAGNGSVPVADNSAKPDAAGNPVAAAANAAAPANGLWGVAEEEDAASHRGIDFIAFNRTGKTVTGLAIRPDEGPLDAGAEETPWSSNILAQRELPDGTRAAAHFEADIELCRWSLRATFADRQTRDYPAVDLCNTIRVDLR
jgi:hypothetical protein